MAPRSTIFARSSGAGRAGVAVYRISGPRAGDVLDAFCGGRGEPRHARLTRLTLADGSLLDEGLVLWFPGPSSFTGEDVAELHLHGSLAVEESLREALLTFGLTLAGAGEFTMRAFEAGKLDLLQAEGLSDLLEAETDSQRRQALGQLGGRLSDRVSSWRQDLVSALAYLEAAVDFPDEEDVPEEISRRALPKLRTVRNGMETALATAGGARAIREGVTVVITGPPNVGKSSILNRLAGEDRAIVSTTAGTTRDVLSVRLSLEGQLVTIIDTAGIRDSVDEIEREGIERARSAASRADILVEVQDASSVSALDVERAVDPRPTVYVANKTDLVRDPVSEPWIAVSASTGEGWEAFESALAGHLSTAHAEVAVLTRDRQVALVRHSTQILQSILVSPVLEPELLVEEVRTCLRFLNEMVGLVTPDEVLGEIFSAFCIGK